MASSRLIPLWVRKNIGPLRASFLKRRELVSQWIHHRLESSFGSFFTFHQRPLWSKGVRTQSDAVKQSRHIAIVMQGPLAHMANFTLETCRLYRRLFPLSTVILSTWEDEDSKILQRIREEGIVIVTSAKPAFAGISNINYQLVSTMQGIRKAEELGAKYILKTRTDQRIYAPNTDEYLWSLIKSFPLMRTTIQKERLIALNLNTFKFRPYSISDMFLFGSLPDMVLYWNIPLDTRKEIPKNFPTVRSWVDQRLCEVYLSTHFLKNIQHNILDTIADSWDAYAHYFCVVDAASIDLYWYKYAREKEYRRLSYETIKNDDELGFRDWLILYASLENKQPPPEQTLHEPFMSSISSV